MYLQIFGSFLLELVYKKYTGTISFFQEKGGFFASFLLFLFEQTKETYEEYGHDGLH